MSRLDDLGKGIVSKNRWGYGDDIRWLCAKLKECEEYFKEEIKCSPHLAMTEKRLLKSIGEEEKP